MGAAVGFVINAVFVALDWTVYGDQFGFFLAVRLALAATLLAIFFRFAQTHARVSQYLICLSLAAGMLAMIYVTEGGSSRYYAGLILLMCGMGILLPLSALEACAIAAFVIGGFAASAVMPYGDAKWGDYGVSLFFLVCAAGEGIAGCVFLDRLRLADFKQRRDLEQVRDELKELDQAKSRFTANVHHELRTPLTLMLAPVEALLAGQFGELAELQRSYLQTIRSNALRLLKLINNLLDLAKVESEQLRIRRRPLRVGSIVDEIVAGAIPLAERKRVSLERRGLDSLPLIHGDPDALEKVIVNLLGNALKFTESGGRIAVEGWPEEGGGIHLQVSDSGIGIPADQLGRIFDRFAQVDGGTTRRFEGTGIGLALVKELVELHGGRVYAQSDGLGLGARMHVVLPVGESDDDAAEAVEEAVLAEEVRPRAASALAGMEAELDLERSEQQQASGELRLTEMERHVERLEASGERSPGPVGAPDDAPEVLVVEDNPDMRRLLAFLVGQEFRVRTARNGREGLELIRERQPDVVLTDVMMPEMSGVELCAAVKGDPATSGIPVVLVTSKAEREMKIEGLERGADDYITKPFHPRELLARVRGFTRLRRLQAELADRNALLERTNAELSTALVELREAGAQLVQAERLAAVGELAAGIAHEVNNPVNFALNAIKALRSHVDEVRTVATAIGQLSGSDVPERLVAKLREIEGLRTQHHFDESVETLAELGEMIGEGLERTSRLVGDLRDFAAPGERRTASVDVTRGLRSTLQLVKHVFTHAGVALEESIPANLPPVEGDARALNQVFLNLLKNAAEAFEGRRGRVQVHARLEGDEVVVSVRDDGPGVAPELRERLFEPFFSTKPAGKGTGLGLSISQRIVAEHGGRIEFDSEPGRGTCVTVRLPSRGAGKTVGDAAQA